MSARRRFVAIGLVLGALGSFGIVANATTTPTPVVTQRREFRPYNTASDAVNDLYRRAAWRNPTAAELRYSTAALSNKSQTVDGMAAALFDTQSFTANEQFIARTYLSLLQRTPDRAGYLYWVSATRGGTYLTGPMRQVSRASFVASMMQTDAFRRNFEYRWKGDELLSANHILVKRAYRYIFRRGEDLAGYRYWSNELNTGRISRVAFITMFLNSPEAKSAFASRTRVIVPALVLLAHQPWESKLDSWRRQLESGITYRQVIRQILDDPDFAAAARPPLTFTPAA